MVGTTEVPVTVEMETKVDGDTGRPNAALEVENGDSIGVMLLVF